MAAVLDAKLESAEYKQEIADQLEAAKIAGTEGGNSDGITRGGEDAQGEMTRGGEFDAVRKAMNARRLDESSDGDDMVAAARAAGDNGVSCMDEDSSICDACVVGYRGDGTNKCRKCSEIVNCKYPRGNKLGPDCEEDASGEETDLVCGECKNGFYGKAGYESAACNGGDGICERYCAPCTPVKGCADDSLVCTNTGDSKCLKCAPGGWLTEAGSCETCTAIPHCLETICDSADSSHCNMCANPAEDGNMYFAAGHECAPLEFDAVLGVWSVRMSE